jgi:transcriptional regulator with XRE-family HTH domain
MNSIKSGRKGSFVVFDFMTIPELAKELGDRLRNCRLRRRLEQTELAERAGISDRTVRALEKGTGSSVESLLRVMKALGILEGLDAMVPPGPSVDPLLLLKRKDMPSKVYKRRKPNA